MFDDFVVNLLLYVTRFEDPAHISFYHPPTIIVHNI